MPSTFQADLVYAAGYGSAKDIHGYKELGLPREKIFIFGKSNKKQQNLATVSMKEFTRPPDKSAYWKTIFFISHQKKYMLRVLKRTVSIRQFFYAPKIHV